MDVWRVSFAAELDAAEIFFQSVLEVMTTTTVLTSIMLPPSICFVFVVVAASGVACQSADWTFGEKFLTTFRSKNSLFSLDALTFIHPQDVPTLSES
jgi:hypothetical protein